MKYLFILLFFVFWTSIVNAQHWKELIQESINLKYELPQGWYVRGYVSNKDCYCTGATINASKDQQINMVIFSTNKETIDSLKQQKVWGYSFATPSASSEIVHTNFLDFEKTVSTWQEDPQAAVLRFAATSVNFRYLIYFWGDLEDITKNSSIIEHILQSIQEL